MDVNMVMDRDRDKNTDILNNNVDILPNDFLKWLKYQ
jgi:hypothetical protein